MYSVLKKSQWLFEQLKGVFKNKTRPDRDGSSVDLGFTRIGRAVSISPRGSRVLDGGERRAIHL